MSDEELDAEPTPTLDGIDDPRGIVYVLPDGVTREDIGERVGEYAIERLQAIRWELHSLTVMLDETEGLTAAATMLIPQAIDLLGVVARAEASYIDDPMGEIDGGRIFEERTEGDEQDDG